MIRKDFHSSFHFLFHSHKWNPEVLEYYIYKVIRVIAYSLLTLFVPIYLIADLGYSIFQVVLFFLINQLFFILFVPFSGFAIEKLGVKHSIMIHLPAMAIFAYGLNFLTGDFIADLWIIFLILGIRSIPKTTQYTADTMFISKHILSDSHQEGKSLAMVKIMIGLATLVSPIIGGFISFYFGFEYFFYFAVALCLLAMIPLLMTKDEYFKIDIKPSSVYRLTFKEISKEFRVAEFGRWFPESIIWLLWPIFIYLIVGNTAEMGILVSASTFIAIVVSYFVGKRIDKVSPKKLLKKMTKLSTGVYFLRSVFPDPFLVTAMDSVNKVINPVLTLPYEKYYYDFIKSKNDLLKMSIIANLYLESVFTLGFIVFAIYFGVLEFLGIDVGYWEFLILFVVFGFFILLMDRVTNLVKE